MAKPKINISTSDYRAHYIDTRCVAGTLMNVPKSRHNQNREDLNAGRRADPVTMALQLFLAQHDVK